MQGFTYTELTNALQTWPAKAPPEYLEDLDRIIQNGELRLIKELNVTIFDVIDTTPVVTSGSRLVAKPAGLISTNALWLITSGTRSRLTSRAREFLMNYAPNPTTSTGTPKYYCDRDDTYWEIAPTPTAGATVESHFVKRPGSIVDDDTTWLGDNAGELLFTACLAEAEHWLKADDRYADFMTKHTEDLSLWKLENRNLLRVGAYSPLPAAGQKV